MESERILARAEDALRRHGMEPRLAKRARAVRRRSFFGKVKRIVLVAGLLTIGLPLWGLVVAPVGTTGLMIAVLAFIIAAVALMAFPRSPLVAGEVLPTTELALLPLKTEEWLLGQRRALPAPATRLVDDIGLKLEILAPQLQALNAREPVATDIRRLIADELPELVKGYQRVPLNLRKEGLNGISPDKQLIDGLAVVDEELDRLSKQLASGDLNRFATQGRYLELKYQGDSGS